MIGSTIHITPSQFRDGWASLQMACGEARLHLQSANSAVEIASAWTALSVGRLTSFATTTLHRVQRLNRITAAAPLTLRHFGLLGDKDIGVGSWRSVSQVVELAISSLAFGGRTKPWSAKNLGGSALRGPPVR